ncbi:phosphate-starvation-inducible PsiE family protein [Chroococcidiopsis sp. CCMEE 29]|uniref:phosphate-starvation-inducible PsiE family protein n=1 Tax=Chroococcidiopsis sp. CCMEE 29 TaxID=155894 RepID=UPI00201FC9B8|nr:phosphate-starvation-inducible PsiE family protein [Chroococcidiopsis sp. CCMEE 29]
MMWRWKKRAITITELSRDESFLKGIHRIENFVSKVLSLALIVVILISLIDLIRLLFQDLMQEPTGFFNKGLIETFGLFLNILIALELLENIAAYLKKHAIQVELVIITSLIAVARKIIIFDFSKATGIDLIGLAIAIFSLSISYWLIRRINAKSHNH